MKVSVIICTYNREKYILDVLTSLKDQSVGHHDYEIIFIDNNSSDATPLVCMQFAQQKGNLQFHYYKETRQGLSYARNRGIELAKASIVVFVDDDAVVCKNYIHEIIVFFENYHFVSVIGGRIFPKFESTQPSWMPRELTPLFSILDLGEHNKPFRKGKYPVGANMAFRKEVFDTCGVFNTDLGRKGKNLMGGEEKDMFYRIKQHGFQVWYAYKPWIYHVIPESRTTKEFIKAQAIGVGQSEYYRCKSHTFIRLISFSKECLKWIASLILALQYLLLGKVGKAQMIIAFRWWVSGGMFNILRIL